MRLTVWILEPDSAAAAQLRSAWQTIAGASVNLCLFQAASEAPSETPPDLLMAEVLHQCAEVTDLLMICRQQKSTDFLPVTADASPSTFTRAQQLGAIDYILKPFTARRLRQSLRRYLSLKQGLAAGSDLTQGQLDLFFFSGVHRQKLPALALPDAQLLTCRRLLSFLYQKMPRQCTVDEAAQALSVSRVTARRYLEILAEAGYVRRLSVHGRSGRPSSVYQLKGEDA